MAENLRSELQLVWQGQSSDFITAIAWSPVATSWVTSSASGEVAWSSGITSLVLLRQADGRSLDNIAFSADGRWLAAGGQAGKLFIWNCDDLHHPPQLIETISIDRWIEHLDWHPTVPQLAIAHRDRLEIWDAPTASQIGTQQFTRSSIFATGWHPTGSVLAIAGYKGLWIGSPAADPDRNQQIAVDTATIALAWSRDGRYLAAGNLDRTLMMVDWQHPDDPWILQGFPSKIRHLDWLAGLDRPCLAVASGSGLLLWDLMPADTTGWSGRYLEGHQSNITALATHPQLPIIATGDRDGYTCLWSAAGEIHQILTNYSQITALTWNACGTYLALGLLNGEIELWDASA